MNFDDNVFVKLYIENPKNGKNEWIFFPTTKDDVLETLSSIDIDEKNSNYIVSECKLELKNKMEYSLSQNANFDELNYLANIILNFKNQYNFDIFEAVLATTDYPTMADIINIANNINCYELYPANNFQEYSQFIDENFVGQYDHIIEKLHNSLDFEERVFAKYVEDLENSLDLKAFTKIYVDEEKGKFTEHGYLVQHGEHKGKYEDKKDIPNEYKIFAYPKPKSEPTFLVYGIKSDEMLGHFLYNNKLLPVDKQLTAAIKLNITSSKSDYYRLLGQNRRKTQNDIFTEKGYAEFCNDKKSVLAQISSVKEEQKTKKGTHHKSKNKNFEH